MATFPKIALWNSTNFCNIQKYILEQDRFMVTLGRRVQEHCRLCVQPTHFTNVRSDATLGCACFVTSDCTPIMFVYRQWENKDEWNNTIAFFCGIHPVVEYHVNIGINITVNHNKFYQFCRYMLCVLIRFISLPTWYTSFSLQSLLICLYMFRTNRSIIRRIKCLITLAASGVVPSVVDLSWVGMTPEAACVIEHLILLMMDRLVRNT